MSLDLKWVSCRQHIYGLVFVSIQLVCVFWLEHLIHLFKVLIITNIDIFLIVLGLFCKSLVLFCSLLIWWPYMVLSLGCFSFCVYLLYFLVLCSHEVLIQQSISVQGSCKLLVSFPPREVLWAFVVNLVWVVMNSLSFCLSINFWSLHWIWMRALLGRVFLVVWLAKSFEFILQPWLHG